MTTLDHSPALGIFIEARSKTPLLRRLLEALIEGRKRKAAEFTRVYVRAHPWLQDELARQKTPKIP